MPKITANSDSGKNNLISGGLHFTNLNATFNRSAQ